jgi:hypothetical protein
MAVGLAVFLGGGILAALMAARLLPAADYTVYAAYSSLVGILVLGPAGSLEQESALRASRAHALARQLLAAMLARSGAIFLVVVVIILMPAFGWQQRMLGPSAGLATVCVLLGTPLVFAAAVGRGYLTAHRTTRPVGAANAATGVAMLLVPFGLHASGLTWLSSFLAGALLAWLPALAIVCSRIPTAATRLPSPVASVGALRHGVTAWLLAGNLLMLAAMLAVPVVLRWHVDAIGADTVADAQVLVSVSRLSTTVVLGFLALMVAQLSVRDAAPDVARRWFVLATGLGLATVGLLALVGNQLVSWLRGVPSDLALVSNLLSTLPVVTLSPAIVATAMAIVRHAWRLIALAWSSALAVLAAAAAADSGGDLGSLLGMIDVACALPLAVLAVGLVRGHRRSGTRWASDGPSQSSLIHGPQSGESA